MEAKIPGFGRGCGEEAFPVAAGFFQQNERAAHIGFKKSHRTVDGTIHMAFRSQVHDRVRFKNFKGRAHGRGIRNIGLDEMIARAVRHIGQRGGIAGVGELIHIDHAPGAGRKHFTNHGRTDEARAARNQKSMCHQIFPWNKLLTVRTY